jgi:hypothetical protein
MRKFIFIVMALLMPFSALEMSADDKNAVIKIPLNFDKGKDLRRDIVPETILSYYYGTVCSIYTYIPYDQGQLDVLVTNCLTGESWYDTFDSGEESQTVLQISGNQGLYEITYTTESGDTYEGSFTIE